MNSMRKFNSMGIVCTLLLYFSGLANVAAQRVIEEIVVTATKRGEVSVQDVVGGIRAVSGEFLRRHDVRTFEDVSRLEPSLQFSRESIGDLRPIIRGIHSPGAGTVAVLFDETPITGVNFQEGGGGTPDIGAYDLNRVEVLKGPQGTIFGTSAMSGAIRFISNKPDASAFDANFSGGGSFLEDGDPGFGANGMINLPIIDGVLALRAVGWHESRGGIVDNFAGLNAVLKKEDADESDKTGGRIMGRWTPNDRLTVDAYYMRQELDVDGPKGWVAEVGHSGVGEANLVLQGPPFAVGQLTTPFTAFFGERIASLPIQNAKTNDIEMFGLTVEYDLGFGTAVATVSHYDTETFNIEDTTAIAQSFSVGVDFGRFFGTGVLQTTAPWASIQNKDREVLSTEVRFSSDFDGPINFVAGFFYEDDERESQFQVSMGDPATGLVPCTLHRECITDLTSAGAQSLLLAEQVFENVESYAFFGNVTYQFTDSWEIGGGLRYFDKDEDDLSQTLQGFQGSDPFTVPPTSGGPVQTVPTVTFEGSTQEDKLTWDAKLAYHHTDDQLYYFRAAEGFRQGSINKNASSAASLGVQIPPDFKSDSVVNLEFGGKTSWYDNRLTVNAAYFKMFWTDIQVLGEDVTGTVDFLTNAAKGEVDGVELEIFAQPTDQLGFNFGVTYLDARLTQDQELGFDPALAGGTAPVGFDGDKIDHVPEWAFSGNVEYSPPFTLMENVDLLLLANYSYSSGSDRFLNDDFGNNFRIGDYFLMDLGAIFTYKNWALRIFAKNVTDKAATIDIEGNGVDPQLTISPDSRAVGAQLQWNFE